MTGWSKYREFRAAGDIIFTNSGNHTNLASNTECHFRRSSPSLNVCVQRIALTCATTGRNGFHARRSSEPFGGARVSQASSPHPPRRRSDSPLSGRRLQGRPVRRAVLGPHQSRVAAAGRPPVRGNPSRPRARAPAPRPQFGTRPSGGPRDTWCSNCGVPLIARPGAAGRRCGAGGRGPALPAASRRRVTVSEPPKPSLGGRRD